MWQNLERRIMAGCTISPILFVMSMHLIIKAAKDKLEDPRCSRLLYTRQQGVLVDLAVSTTTHVQSRLVHRAIIQWHGTEWNSSQIIIAPYREIHTERASRNGTINHTETSQISREVVRRFIRRHQKQDERRRPTPTVAQDDRQNKSSNTSTKLGYTSIVFCPAWCGW